MEDGWRWKAGSQDHRSCQLEICHNLFLPSRHSAKLLARQRSCLSRKSQVPETYVLHFTAMCCLQQTLTSSRIRSCETCQVPSVFLLGNYLYGLNWSCPNLSCMVVQQFNAAHLSASICRNSGAVLKCYEAHQPQVFQARSQNCSWKRVGPRMPATSQPFPIFHRGGLLNYH